MDKRGLAPILTLLFTVGAGAQPVPTTERGVVVISDLHMGIGRDASGAWQASEDFRWAREFEAFLAAADKQGQSAVDLVLNGDALDLTEPDTMARLEQVLAAHKAELTAIANFAKAGSNRVAFVPGDSDAALVVPEVRARLLSAIGAPSDRVTVATEGYWLSRDGRIHAEHGHQVGASGQRTAAGRIVSDLYRRLEPQFPVVDNVAVLGAGLKYALAANPALDAGKDTAALLTYLLFTTMSWQQFRMELDDGDVEPPVWDMAQARSQRGALLGSAVPDDDPLRPVALKALKDGTLDAAAAALSDDEVVMLCDYRAAVRRARRRFEPVVSQFAPRGPAVAECPRTPETRGGAFDYFWRSRDLESARHLEELTRRLPASARPSVFVRGHTHLPDRSQTGANMISGGLLKIAMEGFSPVRGAATPVVINGGAWQRTVTPVQLERMLADRPLQSVQPEDLAPCYSFVSIPAYADSPTPAVRYWRQSDGSAFSIGSSCGG